MNQHSQIIKKFTPGNFKFDVWSNFQHMANKC